MRTNALQTEKATSSLLKGGVETELEIKRETQ